jgi:two-component system sensor kinase FixL
MPLFNTPTPSGSPGDPAILASRDGLMAIIASAPDAIITTDEQLQITGFNTAAESIFACPGSEAIGKSLAIFIPERHRIQCVEHIRTFGEAGLATRAIGTDRPLPALRADGIEFPFEATISQFLVRGQKFYTAIVRDVTERTQAEAALRESEARLRAIVDTAVDGILTIDEQGTVLSFNPGAERLFGYEAIEVVGRNVKLLMPAPYQEEHDGYLANHLRTGEKKIIGIGREVAGRHKNGSEFPIDLAVSETRLDGQRIFTGIIRNLVERKRAREAIAATEQRLNLAVDAVQMGLFEWDVRSGKVAWSHHHARLFGLAPEDFTGTYDAAQACIHPDDRLDSSLRLKRAIAGNGTYFDEFRVVWPDGSEHWIEVRGKLQYGAEGKPTHLLGTVMEITDRKAAEQAAKLHQAELAHLSRVTTMGQMASGLAHELNQPLSAILNYATVSLEHLESVQGVPPVAVTAVREVMDETRRAGAIISRMRSFVRKQQPQNVELDLNELVRESVRMMEFELRHQRIRPHLDLAKDIPKVLGDAVQIEQVLVNLLFNALEAMGERPASGNGLSVRTALHDEGRTVQVCIIDTGCGVPPENMAKLFDPFFTTKPQGLGMGLNICRTIVESQGGRLTAAPNDDRGMRFCFTVPVA